MEAGPRAPRFGDPDFTVLQATGGKLGIVETTIPLILFSPLWVLFDHEIGPAAAITVAISVAFAIARIVRGESLQFALSGAVGIGISAAVAATTGKAENFFLPGILLNIGWATAYLISIMAGRPLLGLIVSQFTREGSAWYRDPERRALYTKASWVWVGMFALRLSIQLPLYLLGAVGPLTAARVFTGIPLFALAFWLSYLVLKPLIDERLAATAAA